jgi:hypothetical protein
MKEKNSNFGRREKPQSCSQCREEGHNKGSIRCPVNIKNAATATLAKERQTKFSEDNQIRENCNNFGKVSNSNLSYEEISSIEVSPILSTGFCSTNGSSSKISNSDAKLGPFILDITDNKKFQSDPPSAYGRRRRRP